MHGLGYSVLLRLLFHLISIICLAQAATTFMVLVLNDRSELLEALVVRGSQFVNAFRFLPKLASFTLFTRLFIQVGFTHLDSLVFLAAEIFCGHGFIDPQNSLKLAPKGLMFLFL